MAQRITWQNVAAPDFSDAIRARESAAEMISKAFSQIGGSLGEIDNRNTDQLNTVAINEAMKINDLGSWDKLLSGQGLAGLGINPARANSALLEYAQGKKGDLMSDRASEQSFQNGLFDREQAEYGFGRTKMMDARTDEEYDKGLAQEQLRLEIGNRVFKMGEEEDSKQSLEARIENEARANGWDAVTTQLHLDAARSQDDARWAIAPGLQEELELTPEFTTVRNAISEREAARKLKIGADATFRFYDAAMGEFSGYKNLGEGIADKLMSKLDPGMPKDEQSVHAQKAGKVQDLYNSLIKDPAYKLLPPEMVALALEQHMTSNGWFFSGDQTKLDEGAARGMLDQISSNFDLKALEQKRSELDMDRRIAEKDKSDYDNALRKAALARDNNDAEGYRRAMTELGKVSSSVSPDAGKAPPATNRTMRVSPPGTLKFGNLGGGALPDQVAAALEGSAMKPPVTAGPDLQFGPLSVNPGAIAQSMQPSVSDVARSLETYYPGSGYEDVMRGGPRNPPPAPNRVNPVVEAPAPDVNVNQVTQQWGSQQGGMSPDMVEQARALVNELGLPPEAADEVARLNAIVSTGRDPATGQPATAEQKAQAEKILGQLLKGR